MIRSRFPPRVDRGPEGVAVRSWGLALCLLTVPALAFGQSLGDAARKERERRDSPNKTGTASRTVTEDDLASNEGRLANDPNVASVGRTEEKPERASPPQARLLRITPPSPTAGSGEAYWRTMVSQARQEVAMAQEYYEDLQRQIRFGQPPQYLNGRRVIKSARTMKAMADVAQEELQRAEEFLEELLEEARRDGALPGWLREGAQGEGPLVIPAY